MTTDQDALDAAARAVQAIQHTVGPARARVATGQPKEQTDLLLAEALEHAQTAHTLLVDVLGAKRPGLSVGRDSVPLEKLSTPASRTLVEALEVATRAAEEVDQERGWIDEDGEPIGFGELLGGILLGLTREVYGARGRGLE